MGSSLAEEITRKLSTLASSLPIGSISRETYDEGGDDAGSRALVRAAISLMKRMHWKEANAIAADEKFGRRLSDAARAEDICIVESFDLSERWAFYFVSF